VHCYIQVYVGLFDPVLERAICCIVLITDRSCNVHIQACLTKQYNLVPVARGQRCPATKKVTVTLHPLGYAPEEFVQNCDPQFSSV